MTKGRHSAAAPSARLFKHVAIAFLAVTALLWGLKLAAQALGIIGDTSAQSMSQATAPVDDSTATVIRVIDGDSLIVDLNGTDTTIRLLNVDTPETKNPNTEVQCMGPEASEWLAKRLPPGTRVDLTYDVERHDRYGRTLAGVTHTNSLVNAEIAREGLGTAVLFVPNERYYQQVLDAQAQAQQSETGLFDPEIDCTLPAQVQAIQALNQQVQALQPTDPGAVDAAEALYAQITTIAEPILAGSFDAYGGSALSAQSVWVYVDGQRKSVEAAEETAVRRIDALRAAKPTAPSPSTAPTPVPKPSASSGPK